MSKEVDIPALNWFIHVLCKNIGGVDWVPMTPQELAERKQLTGSDYPYKVVRHPILEGNTISLEKGKYKIECSDPYVRDLIIGLALRFQTVEKDYHHLVQEKLSEVWHPASEVPDGQFSAHRCRRVLVFSPELMYIISNGVCFGHHDNRNNRWYIDVKGKSIQHSITHWRHLPPGATEPPEYEEIKDRVKALKEALGQ